MSLYAFRKSSWYTDPPPTTVIEITRHMGVSESEQHPIKLKLRENLSTPHPTYMVYYVHIQHSTILLQARYHLYLLFVETVMDHNFLLKT